MKNIININDSITIEINKKFGKTIITLNKNEQKEVLSNLKTNDYFWSDVKFDENYIIIYSRGCMVNQIPLKIESAYNIKTDTILDVQKDKKLATELDYMLISKQGFDIGTTLSVINSSNLEVADNKDVENMIKYLTNGNNNITREEVINYIVKAYPLLSRFSQIETPLTVMDYKMILKEFGSSYLYFHKMPQIIDSSINKLKKVKEPMHRSISVLKVMAEYDKKASEYGKNSPIEDMSKKEKGISTFSNNDDLNACNKRTSCEKKIGDQRSIVDYIDFYPVGNKEEAEPEQHTFDVLAVPCDRAFVVVPEKVEEFKNSKSNPEIIEQTEEMAEEFRTNNLGPVLKKTRKPNK